MSGRWSLSALLALSLIGCKPASPGPNGAAGAGGSGPLLNLSGQPASPFGNTNQAAVVLIFAGVECPISNRYAPELARLHRKFAGQRIGWWLVYPGTNYSVERIRTHLREFDLAGDVLLDPRLALARQAQVRVTPETAVFYPDGRLVYHGRIDDRFPTLGVERPAPTRRDLEEVLESILAGNVITPAQTKAVGCFIEGLP